MDVGPESLVRRTGNTNRALRRARSKGPRFPRLYFALMRLVLKNHLATHWCLLKSAICVGFRLLRPAKPFSPCLVRLGYPKPTTPERGISPIACSIRYGPARTDNHWLLCEFVHSIKTTRCKGSLLDTFGAARLHPRRSPSSFAGVMSICHRSANPLAKMRA